MQLACVQLNTVWKNKAANYERAAQLLDGARLAPGTLVILPEMFATGFSMDVAAVAEDASRRTELFLSQTAVARGIFVLAGLVTRDAGGLGRNEAVLFSPDGRERARYCKLHPFSFADEDRHYAPGASVQTAACQEFTLSPLICYDLRFPEAFRAGMRRGANLFCVLANWPQAREAHWLALLKARAIENQAYVAGVNRCGRDTSLAYSGRSLILDPRGEVLADGGTEECVITAEPDLAALQRYRQDFPALADIRADLFG